MSTLNVDKLKERLRVIQGTEDGIRTLSRYFLTNYRHAAACVRAWAEVVQTVEPTKLLSLLYLANDVAQRSARHGTAFLSGFRDVVPFIMRRIGHDCGDVAPKARRVLSIWQKRRVYPADALATFEAQLKAGEERASGRMSDPLDVEFVEKVMQTPAAAGGHIDTDEEEADVSMGDAGAQAGPGDDTTTVDGSGVDATILHATLASFDDLPLYERLESRKRAMATCAWLARRMQQPHHQSLLSPEWNVKDADVASRRRTDVMADVEHAQRVILDLKATLRTLKHEEPHLFKAIQQAQRQEEERIAETERRIKECHAIAAQLDELSKAEASGKLAVKQRQGVEVLSLLSTSTASDLMDVGAEEAAGRRVVAPTTAEELQAKEDQLQHAADAAAEDDVTAEVLAAAVAETAEERKKVEKEEASKVDSVFKFDANNPDAGRDLVWNPIVRDFTPKPKEDAWRDR